MTTMQHPWLAHLSTDDDDRPDVGDPRDLVEPAIRQTPAGRWDDAAPCRCDRFDVGCASCSERRVLRRAELFAMRAEPAIRAAEGTPEETFARLGGDVTEHVATTLRSRWAYGPRFWAWWQRRKTINAIEQLAPALRVAVREHCESQRSPIAADPDPRPVLTLANGETVRADEMWWWNKTEWANGDGSSWYRHHGRWYLNEKGQPYRAQDIPAEAARVYPPEAAKPKPTPSTNAHGIDVSAIRAGDYVRKREGQWAQVAHLWRRGSLHARLDSGAGIHTYFNHPDDVFDHRPAPRIVLPGGREVAAETAWRSRINRSDHVAVHDGRRWYWRPVGDLSRAGPPSDGRAEDCGSAERTELGADWERLWPPLDVVPA